jgi:uncharacterized protein YdeI (YjbR/CyaY-like superfamily)
MADQLQKATGKAHMETDEIVTEALCFGWIDSKSAALDDRSMLWIAPHRGGARWSKINKARIERAIAAGQTRRHVEQARRRGSA